MAAVDSAASSDPASGPRTHVEIERTPPDVLRLVVAAASLLAVLLVEALLGRRISRVASDLFRGVDAIDEDILTGLVVTARVVTVGLLVAGLGAVLLKGRWRACLGALTGAAAGGLLCALVQPLVDAERPPLTDLSDAVGPLTEAEFPTAVGLAVAAGVATASGPWLRRRARRAAWVAVLLLTGAHLVTAPVTAMPFVALLCGWTGGALTNVVLGAPTARPTAAAVVDALRAVGVAVDELERASVDARGSTPYLGKGADGRLFVKVLGKDERSADVLFRLYRLARRRDLGDERPFSSLRRAVEHEALLSLAVARLGVRTPAHAGFAMVDADTFVLTYAAVAGRSLDRLPPERLTDDVLADIWREVAILRSHRVAHRDLRLANVFLADDGRVWMIDFGFSELAARDLLLATDVAELLTALSLQVGPERAAASGRAVLGDQVLATALPRLRPNVLSGATRTALKGAPGLLEQLRPAVASGGVATTTGSEPTEVRR